MSTAVATHEYPILFAPDMLRLVRAGRKTQTRRVVKWKPREQGLNLSFSGLELGHYFTDHPESGSVLRSRDGNGCWNDRTFPARCPYGQVGDRLWVRESIYCDLSGYESGPFPKEPTDHLKKWVYYRVDGTCCEQIPECACAEVGKPRWRSPIHMPRWAARTFLEITEIRCQRLKDISYEDALAEGFDPVQSSDPVFSEVGTVLNFLDRWDQLNAGRKGLLAVKHNPVVWAITFHLLPSEEP